MKIGTETFSIRFSWKWKSITIFHPWKGCYLEHYLYWSKGVKYWNQDLPF